MPKNSREREPLRLPQAAFAAHLDAHAGPDLNNGGAALQELLPAAGETRKPGEPNMKKPGNLKFWEREDILFVENSIVWCK